MIEAEKETNVPFKAQESKQRMALLWMMMIHYTVLSFASSGSNREFTVAEDGMYYLGVINLSLRSITMNMNIKIASKMYDTSKATSICSTSNGECKLKLLFPNAQYYVLATSDSEVSVLRSYPSLYTKTLESMAFVP